MSKRLPEPSLTKILRLEASLGEAIDVGNVPRGRRRIVPLIGGTFAGPELNGTLLPGASADWQILLPDGTALGDIRYTLRTDHGDVLYVRSQGVRRGQRGGSRPTQSWRGRGPRVSTCSARQRRSRRPLPISTG